MVFRLEIGAFDNAGDILSISGDLSQFFVKSGLLLPVSMVRFGLEAPDRMSAVAISMLFFAFSELSVSSSSELDDDPFGNSVSAK